MSILVIGATGFIGRPLVDSLQAGGDEVVAVSRQGMGVDAVACDRGDIAALVDLVSARRAQTVVDLLAYTDGATAPLLAALGGRVDRYVLVSSMDVYRNYEGLHGKSRPPPVQGPMAEGAPLRVTRYPYRSEPRRPMAAADAWLDDYDKIPLEAAVRQGDFRHTILRLPMVYGPRDRQRRFRWVISPMLKGRPTLSVDPAWSTWRTTYGFVDDVADAVARAAARPGAPSGTFNLGEAEPPEHHVWIDRFAETLNWKGAVDFIAAPPGSPVGGLDLDYTLIADTRAFRDAYRWMEPTSLAERLDRTAADERRRAAN